MRTRMLVNEKQPIGRRRIGKTMTGLMLASLCLAQPARAAIITVTSTADSGAGTLREALATAGNGDTIDATGVSGTILLTSGELVVPKSLTIVGPGPATLAVDGNATSGVFNINPSLTVSVSGLAITNGAAIWGGGLYNDHSTLTLSNCNVSGNAAVIGGGLYNAGSGGTATLRLIASRIEGNAAVGLGGAVPFPGQGGGLYNSGDSGSATLEVKGSTITGNTAADTGGGLYNVGISGSASLNVLGSTVSDNSAREGGGIANAHATLTVSNSTFTGNVVSNGNGGAILNFGRFPGSATATITGSSLSNNMAKSDYPNTDNGGAICNDGSGISGSATMTVIASTIHGNSTDFRGNGGGLYNVGDDTGNAMMTLIASAVSSNQAGSGGGIGNQAVSGTATLTVSNCTISANSRGGMFNYASESGTATVEIVASTLSTNGPNSGGIFTYAASNCLASVTIFASTLYGNTAGVEGGAIRNVATYTGKATLELYNSTFTANSVDIDSNDPFDTAGGAIANSTGGLISDFETAKPEVFVYACTFSGNVAERGGAIANFRGDVDIGSSIFQYGDVGANIFNPLFSRPDVQARGSIRSHGFNVINDDPGDEWTGGLPWDKVNTDPLLSPLQNNGGPTLTHALLPGSPAIDWGTNFLAVATDQRGFPRTVDNPAISNVVVSGIARGDGTDSGAFELQNFAPAVLCSNVTVVAGAGCAANASIDGGTYDPDAGDTFTLSQSPAGPYPVGQTLVTLTAVDNHGSSNSCQSIVTVTPVADVGIAKAVVNGQGKPGQALIYTLTVRNFGPCSASGVTVADVVPAGTTFVSASPTPASAPPAGSVGTVTWNLGTMSSGGQTNLTLTVKVSTKGNPQIVNTATVTSTSSDPNAANNSATVTTTRKAK